MLYWKKQPGSRCFCRASLQKTGEFVVANLLLKNALILTMDQALTTVQRGYLQIRGDRIAALGEGEPPFPKRGTRCWTAAERSSSRG